MPGAAMSGVVGDGAGRLRRWSGVGVARAVAALAIVVAWFVQARPGRSAMLDQARSLVRDKKPDLALQYLNNYLENNPESAEALDLKSTLLAETARTPDQILEAIKV